MLTTRVADAITDDVILAFDGTGDNAQPHPSLGEVRELSGRRPLRAVSILRGGEPIAFAACRTDAVRIHGVSVLAYRRVGADLHDYGRLYARDASALRTLLDAIAEDARAVGADVIALDDMLIPVGVEVVPSSMITSGRTALFRAKRDPRGWGGIIKRKSLNRHWNLVAKQNGFRVETEVGSLRRSTILELAELHKERCCFQDQPSAFETPERIDQYLAHPSNKVLTRVWVGDEMLCCHYGMRYGELLLWHTPVINIKYLLLSPLEILLAASARYCEAASITTLDFGLGSEAYKSRFANDDRVVHSILIPNTGRGGIVAGLRRSGLNTIGKRALSGALAVARTAKRFVSTRQNAIHWYEATRTCKEMLPRSATRLVLHRDYEGLVDYLRSRGLPPHKTHYERIRGRAIFLALDDGQSVCCHGWLTTADDFFASEIGRTIPTQGAAVIFDVYTPPEHRGNGYFKTLLRHILGSAEVPQKLAIFASSTNVASKKSILGAGFVETSLLSGTGRDRPARGRVDAFTRPKS